MAPAPTLIRRLMAAAMTSLAAVAALSGCAASSAPAPSESAPAAAEAEWPLTFENADGTTTEIPAKPEHIVSTSVTVTGTLLAIEAPVAASSGAASGKFFPQWASVAAERGVQTLFPAGEPDLEAIDAQAPDLIVVSATGADSLKDQLAELQAIAPTILVDYGTSWQELGEALGRATGLEESAASVADTFDRHVDEAAAKIEVPAGTANIVSYNGPGDTNPIARVGSAQASVLEDLGFTIEDPNTAWHSQGELRKDFVWAGYEHLTELTSATTFIVAKNQEQAQAFAADPTLANVPSVAAGQVYGLGEHSFRVDYFSATEIVDAVVAQLGK